MSEGCEAYADALVEHAAGRLGGPAAHRLERHVAECDDCREALGVIRAVRRAAVPVPDGLESRVRASVRAATERDGVSAEAVVRPIRRRRVDWRAWAVPLAAAAMLAGIWAVGGNDGGLMTDEDASAEYAPYGALPGSDGLLAGEALLSELSVEELERLLEEMES